jgi:hypothetical protein
MLGFIPVYTSVMMFGLWIASSRWGFLKAMALWSVVPLATAAADYLEDACQLKYFRLHEKGEKPSAVLTVFSCTMSTVKFAGFFSGFAMVLGNLAAGTLDVGCDLAGWRARFVVLISSAMAAVLLAAGGLWIYSRFVRREQVGPGRPKPSAKSATSGG